MWQVLDKTQSGSGLSWQVVQVTDPAPASACITGCLAEAAPPAYLCRCGMELSHRPLCCPILPCQQGSWEPWQRGRKRGVYLRQEP